MGHVWKPGWRGGRNPLHIAVFHEWVCWWALLHCSKGIQDSHGICSTLLRWREPPLHQRCASHHFHLHHHLLLLQWNTCKKKHKAWNCSFYGSGGALNEQVVWKMMQEWGSCERNMEDKVGMRYGEELWEKKKEEEPWMMNGKERFHWFGHIFFHLFVWWWWKLMSWQLTILKLF